MAKKRLVIANWKTYVETPKAAREFTKALRLRVWSFAGVDVVIAPPFPLISAVAEDLKGSTLRVGAQSVSAFLPGAHTGDVTAATLKASGAALAIVGHSERRAAGETDENVRDALMHTVGAGLRAALCIGERERDATGAYFDILDKQLSSALSDFPKTSASKLLIAYEPIWAIGKSAEQAMKPDALRETVIFIRKTLVHYLGREAGLSVPILYGGSVEPANVEALLAGGDVSGFLVGHASAVLEPFIEILTMMAAKKKR